MGFFDESETNINSCKSKMGLGRSPTSLISPLIMIQMRWLLDIRLIFNSPWWYTWIYFLFIVELTLFPIKALNLLSKYALYLPIPKFYENACYHELNPCLNDVLDYLDTYLILIKCMWSDILFKLTLIVLWLRLKSSSSTHPNSPLWL